MIASSFMAKGSALAAALATRDQETARAARKALITLTAHDLGPLRTPWRRWVQAHRAERRWHGLVDALGDGRDEIRALAAEELSFLLGHGRRISPDACLADYLRLQREYTVQLGLPARPDPDR
mgnify:CR=1 FL=1